MIALRIAVVATALAATACSSCGKNQQPVANGASGGPAGDGSAEPSPRTSGSSEPKASQHDKLLWANAKDGTEEDLATLARHEGAAGLVEMASDDDDLRATAIRAMAYARGWAQLPYLAKVAAAKDDADAKLALDAIVDLAARPRTQDDPEDAAELEEGCAALTGLAKDATRVRERRVRTIRALRMMPCTKAELPTDVDTR